MTTPFIVTLTGPSCAGKTTLEARLKGEGFACAVSTTTRPARHEEVNGKNYHFISKSEFKRLETLGAFVETVKFNGHYYALSAREAERVSSQGKPMVVVVEPQGLKQIRTYCRRRGWDHYAVFVDNPGNIIGERFLARYMSELEKAVGNNADEETIRRIQSTYAARLGVMLKDECWWGEDIGPMCDLWINELNNATIDRAVKQITNAATQAAAIC